MDGAADQMRAVPQNVFPFAKVALSEVQRAE
jgi:hypothetical protein